ncbi:MAG: hypothetical protein ACRESR_03735 [Gammaproteobacteria bacterium]
MRNCLILGCGRSGTSMLAGTLAGAGYYLGRGQYRARGANPKGFFESLAINAINERILAPQVPLRSRWWPLRTWRRVFPSERWLARLPLDTSIDATPKIRQKIAKQVAHTPFAFKDPRFCYTLPAWRPLLPEDTAFLCIFREPGRTAASLLAEGRHKYPDIQLDPEEVFGIWTAMYTQILDRHRHEGDWLFVHFNQLLDGSAFAALESFLDAPADRDFPDRDLRRSETLAAPEDALDLYRQLCTLATYTP